MTEYPAQALTEALQHADAPVDFGRAAGLALRHFDAITEQRRPQLACRAGCSLCCSLRVDVFAHEVFHLAHFIQDRFTPDEIAALIVRLQVHADAVLPLTPFEHATRNIRCALLLPDGRCGVYEARPHSCRRHHSQDFAACQYTFDHPTDIETPAAHDRALYRTLTEAMHQGIEVYAALGFDYTIYELGTALAEALEDPACWERWRQHQPAFRRASITPAA